MTDSYRQVIDTFFAEQHISRRMIMEVHNDSSVCAMVREGLGISIVNPFTVIDFSQHDPDSFCTRTFY
nr:LysR substrate-binding domain-containing protein [Candidatus Arsenophonus triatominarum]